LGRSGSSGGGMPSARGSEHKARDMEDSRKRYQENMEKIFGEWVPWYERKEREDGSEEAR